MKTQVEVYLESKIKKENQIYKQELLNYIKGCEIRIEESNNKIAIATKEIAQRKETKRLALIQINDAKKTIKNLK